MKKKRNATQKKSKAKPQVKRPVVFSIGDGNEQTLPQDKEDRLRKQQAALGAMAKTMLAGLERQDRENWEINRQYENEPVVPGSIEWHKHQQ